MPSGRNSFDNKFVNITNETGIVSIDSINWTWQNYELLGYDESAFELWKYNSSGWILLNDSPIVAQNMFSMEELNPSSDYGILYANLTECAVLNSPGVYRMEGDMEGAPNDIPGFFNPTTACMVLDTSDVVLDCNGFNITNNGTPNAAGISINSSFGAPYTNVTIANCPSISGYYNGIHVFQGNDTLIANSTIFNNTEGISLDRFEFGNITGVQVYNSSIGVALERISNLEMSHLRLWNNSLQGIGFLYTTFENVLMHNITAWNNDRAILLASELGSAPVPSNTNITYSELRNNNYGLYAEGNSQTRMGKVRLRHSTLHVNNYSIYGRLVHEGFFTTDNFMYLTNVTSHSNHIAGAVFNLSNIISDGFYSYNNTLDMRIANLDDPAFGYGSFDLNMTDLNILPDSGDYQNYTNLTINDTVERGDMYTIDWTSNSSALPPSRKSFAQKFINISHENGSIEIDRTVWHWNDSESAGLPEAQFELWKFNATGWVMLNNTPDSFGNSLSLYDFNPLSDYGIMYFNFTDCMVIENPGNYVVQDDLSGAPSNIGGYFIPDDACIVISSSDVTLDCDGYNITNNGTGNAAGIAINGSAFGPIVYDNISVTNCPSISGYDYGLYLNYANDTVLKNLSVHNNTRGMYTYGPFWDEYNVDFNDSEIFNCTDGIRVGAGAGLEFHNLLMWNNTGYSILLSELYSDILLDNITVWDSNVAVKLDSGMPIPGPVSIIDSEFFGNTYGVDTGFISNPPSPVGPVYLNGSLIHNNQYSLELNDTLLFSITDSEVHSSAAGIYATHTNIVSSGLTLYNNSEDLLFGNTVPSFSPPSNYTLNMSKTAFLAPDGSSNFTNLSVNDSIDIGEVILFNHSNVPAAAPGNYSIIGNKMVNITNLSGAASIDSLVWHWLDSEIGDYEETLFRIVTYHGAWEEVANQVLDTAANMITVTCLDDFSPFGPMSYNTTNLSITKLNMTDLNPSPGGLVQFNITVNNTGNVTLNPVEVVDVLPNGLTYSNADPAPSTVSGQTITWNNIGSLGPNAAAIIFVNATADSWVANASSPITELSNYVNATGTPPLGVNTTSEEEGNATVFLANLSIEKTDITSVTATPGGLVEFEINVSNSGYVNLTAINVTDTLPAGFTFVSASPVEDSSPGMQVIWNDIGHIDAGSYRILYVNATIDSITTPGTYTNTADAEASPENGDNVTGSGSGPIHVNSSSLLITKTPSDLNPIVGDRVLYTVVITNDGDVNVSNISVSDTLPANVNFVDASPVPDIIAGNILNWTDLTNLSPGDSVTLLYNVTAAAGGAAQNNVYAEGSVDNGDNATESMSSTITISTPTPPPSYRRDAERGSVSWRTECPGDILVVEVSAGEPIENAEVKLVRVDSEFGIVGEENTDSDGEATFEIDDEGEYRIYVSAGGYSFRDPYSLSFSLCAECISDDDCLDLEMCSDGSCEPVTGECGYAEDHEWIEYECCADAECPEGFSCSDHECIETVEPPPVDEDECSDDSDCPATEYCSGGDCIPVPEGTCGYIEDHEWVDYECCSDEDCEEGYVCEENECVRPEDFRIDTDDVGFIGEDHVVIVYRDGEPFAGGRVRIETPDGQVFDREADEDGIVVLPLEAEGSYELTLLLDDVIVDQADVSSRIIDGDGRDGGLFALLDDIANVAPFILLILGIVILLFLLYRRRKKLPFVSVGKKK
jgi:uncharacterized repeat protein (TIGR01451 family)